MRKKQVQKNIIYGLMSYVFINALHFLVRLVFIRKLSIEYLGLDGLFSNILAMLSLAELGVAPAMVYALYRPLAIKDYKTVNSIMHLFRRMYILIGLVILCLGLCLYPFLDNLIKGKHGIDHIEYFYLIFLTNTVVSYFWSYKGSLLIADQKQYVFNVYHTVVKCLTILLQILFLFLFPSYWCFVILMLLGTLIDNLLISRHVDRNYDCLREKPSRLKEEIKKQITQNIKALLAHKIGDTVVFGTSNLVLSKYIGLAAVGLYDNYYLVVRVLYAFSAKFFGGFTASIGNLMVENNRAKNLWLFKLMETVTGLQAAIGLCGLTVLLNPLIELWLGKAYLFEQSTVTLFALSFYLTYMRKGVLTFRDACGLYWQDRYKPLVEAIINLFVSVFLTLKYGLVGVIWGNIISTLATCFWVEPYILLKYVIDMKLRTYFAHYFAFGTVAAASTAASYYLYNYLLPEVTIINFVLGMVLCIIVSCIIWLLCFGRNEEMTYIIGMVRNQLRRLL